MAMSQPVTCLGLLFFARLLALAVSSNTACSQGQCTGSSLLQHSFASGRLEAQGGMRSDDAVIDKEQSQDKTAKTSVERWDLANARLNLETNDEYTTGAGMLDRLDIRSHNKCIANSPDGRLFLCGESFKYVRYFKWEAMMWTDRGLPIFNDSTWATWTDWRYIDSRTIQLNSATWCWPNQSKPFEVLPNGDHFYRVMLMGTIRHHEMNITVSNPYTAEANITDISMDFGKQAVPEFGKYGYFSGDGKLWVGVEHEGTNLIYSALPEDGEPCAACSMRWHQPRPLGVMHRDPDGLNLPRRYGAAKYPFLDPLGNEFNETYHMHGKYAWLDMEGKNIWMGSLSSTRVFGQDTGGLEIELDEAINSAEMAAFRFMASFLWNFESERTKAQRFPGEEHTSGVGSGSPYQLPVGTGHHVLPIMDAWSEIFTEVSLADIWKAPHWNIVWLPMSPIFRAGENRDFRPGPEMVPDMSRNFFTGIRKGDVTQSFRHFTVPWVLQPMGQTLRTKRGVIEVNFNTNKDIPGLTRPTRAFTAEITIKPVSGMRWPQGVYIISHPGLELVAQSFSLIWRFNGVSVWGGFYDNEWSHHTLVFDGVDGVLTSYTNGVEVETVHLCDVHIEGSTMKEFQLDPSAPLYLANNRSDDFWSMETHFNGWLDGFRLMGHARSQRNICKSSPGADCHQHISYQPTSTQYEIGMQFQHCNETTMHTCGCYAAIHRVCANHAAKLEKLQGTENVHLGALTPPGAPVSMGGVALGITTKNGRPAVTVACSPYDHHLSVPVEWQHMRQFHSGCHLMTDHETPAFQCNLAARQFCKAADEAVSPELATGIIFEAEFRAWVTCFAATEVIPVDVSAAEHPCSTDLEGIDCHYTAAAACTTAGHNGGIIQEVSEDNATISVHCFNAPALLAGVTDFYL